MSHYRGISTRVFSFVVLLLLTALLSVQPAWSVDTGGFSKGLLWKVSKGGKFQGYVLGTIHSEDPRVMAAGDKLATYLDKVEGLAIEVELTPEAMTEVQMAMMLPDSTSLKEMIGEQLFASLVPVAAKYGVPEIVLQRMRPWAIAMTLSMPPSKGGLPLDLKLFAKANSAEKVTSGLETLHEQLSVFTDMSESDQVMMLKETLEFHDQIAVTMEQMHEIWLQKDLKKLMEMNEKLMTIGDQAMNERMMKKLIDERNVRMVERSIKLFEQRTTLIAVGALHLPGKNGVLAGLKAKGYKLKAVW